jgi:multisubunit Na+/H+ antiporter MnhF subunit
VRCAVGERHTIRDHRGRKVELCDFKSLPREMPAEVRNEVGRAAAQQCSNRLWAIGTMTLAVFGQLLIIGLVGSVSNFDIVFRIVLVGVIGTVVLCWWLWRGNTRAAAAIRRCVTWGACPSCGYPLAASKVEADGCRVCSECGAAWRAAPMRSGT